MRMNDNTEKWKEWRNVPVDKLALQLAGRADVAADYVLRQVEGWQKLRRKVPAWAAVEGLEYPHRLALEQCSGEAAARCKADIIGQMVKHLREGTPTKVAVETNDGADAEMCVRLRPTVDENAPERPLTFTDLTGGLGVDFSFIAPLFDRAVYVERQESLCRLARHNLPLLGLQRAEVVCGDGVEYLQKMNPVDVLFLDPARRDGAGRKTVLIEDCEPDVCRLQELLLRKARCVVLKLSTMLDITGAVGALQGVRRVHVVSVGGECKDLLIVMSAHDGLFPENSGPVIVAHEGGESLCFTLADEAAARPVYANACESFLYEPGPAVLKAGAFRTVAQVYGLKKLHPHSHLYTADRRISPFPGRTFRVIGEYGFGKADLKRLRTLCAQANLTVRNFPASVEALRKKLKLREGGEHYIFATTMADGRHAILLCQKA